MRRITKKLPRWEVAAQVHERGNRPLTIIVDPHCVTVTPKGFRKGFSLPWAAIYQLAAQAEVARSKKEKAAARKSRRSAKRVGLLR